MKHGTHVVFKNTDRWGDSVVLVVPPNCDGLVVRTEMASGGRGVPVHLDDAAITALAAFFRDHGHQAALTHSPDRQEPTP